MPQACTLVVAALGASNAFGFTSSNAKLSSAISRLDMGSSVSPEPESPYSNRLPKMSEAIPFLERPKFLTGELAGDVGFDPLGFAKNRDILMEYREAEIKHARLAMLAAAGWPLSEVFDKKIAMFFGVEPALDAADRVPSVLNGGMEKISPIWWGFCLGLSAAIDLYGVKRAREAGPDSDYIPGDLGFDPLGLYPDTEVERKKMRLAEIKHGRTAMMAVLAFALQEAISQVGVVDETPFFFFPLTQTLRRFLEDLAN